MLTIRLQRIGRRNTPSYRVIVVDSRSAAKKGKPVELLGSHDPICKNTELKAERIKHWIGQGAHLSDTMHNLLVKNGIIEGKAKNVLPKKSPIVSETPEEPAAPAAPAEPAAAEQQEAAPAEESAAEQSEPAPAEDAAETPEPTKEETPAEEQ